MKLLEYFLRKNRLSLQRWTCLRKRTISWWARFGYKSKRLAFFTRFFLHLYLFEKWNQKQSTPLTLKQILSQHPSNKLSTLMVFPDTKKSTLLCMQSQFSPSCLESCSVMLDMVDACWVPVFGCWEVKLPKECFLMFTKWGTCSSWWDFSHFMQDGFTTSSLLFLWMYLEAATIKLESKNLPNKQKAVFILLDLIQNGSEHRMNLTTLTHLRWNLLWSLECFKWVSVILFLI